MVQHEAMFRKDGRHIFISFGGKVVKKPSQYPIVRGMTSDTTLLHAKTPFTAGTMSEGLPLCKRGLSSEWHVRISFVL